MSPIRLSLVLAAFLAGAPSVLAQPAAFPNLPAFERPLDLTHAADGSDRLFVVEQGGRVWTFDNDADVSQRRLFLDISDRVFEATGEGGLLSIAFAPDFEEKPFVYAYYVAGDPNDPDNTRTSRVARFAINDADPDDALEGSETIILEVAQPDFGHKGGKILFDPNNLLYVPLGDGGSGPGLSANGQDRTVLLGKVLRLDVNNPDAGREYGVPAGNPYVGNTEGFREEIWAYGLRNPWRASVDRATGDLWLGDVGDMHAEEVNRIVPGGNYGWDAAEGDLCHGPQAVCDDPSLVDPEWFYLHSDEDGSSITGGFVYRGPDAPALTGRYVYGDFISRRIWALDTDAPGGPQNVLLGEAPGMLASFGEDEAGELYAVPIFGGFIVRVADLAGATAAEPPAPGPGLAPTLRVAGPNPFGAQTRLTFASPTAGRARLAVYDVLGREVARPFAGTLAAGTTREATLDAARWAPGAYLVRLTTAGGAVQQRVTVAR